MILMFIIMRNRYYRGYIELIHLLTNYSYNISLTCQKFVVYVPKVRYIRAKSSLQKSAIASLARNGVSYTYITQIYYTLLTHHSSQTFNINRALNRTVNVTQRDGGSGEGLSANLYYRKLRETAIYV